MIQKGLYYRLTRIGETYFEAWETVSEAKDEALLSVVVTDEQPNSRLIHVKLKGLDPKARYCMEMKADIDEKTLNVPDFPGSAQIRAFLDQNGRSYSGAGLMNGGVTIPWVMGNYPAFQLYFQKI